MHTNRLLHESSPYLLQHAHNPVDWYPWGEEAFERARSENKPVLVSIGYAACHWCHVMERESFEDEAVAALMNEHFVNIKVDREERPDVDGIYMDAVQAITGSGGWPLHVFLTPDRKPFYGGTYYPPKKAFNRASWTEVLLSVAEAFRERRSEIEQQAEALTRHIEESGAALLKGIAPEEGWGEKDLKTAFGNLMKSADRQWGGFGRAPKFPQTFTLSWLLAYSEAFGDGEARQHALHSLTQMAQGGIFDHIGGGFARYSTDEEWLAPHFEKMLYDNALLALLLTDAWQLTGDPLYRETLERTLAFVERELMHPDGGFYSSLDADSEGEEGKYYVWTYSEVKDLLGADAQLFCSYYDITPGGNWEGRSIPRVLKPLGAFAAGVNRGEEEVRSLLERGREMLLEARGKRVRPGLDDKVLLGWNALMNTAFSRAWGATGEAHYGEVARNNMNFLLKAFRDGKGALHHTWKDGRSRYPAFLDDHAFFIWALLELGQVSSDHSLFEEARGLAKGVLEAFSDKDTPYFFYTPEGQKDIPVRKIEVYDGATPSGNALMAQNLLRLSVLFGEEEWRSRTEAMVGGMAATAVAYPASFGVWLSVLFEIVRGTRELAIIGPEWENYLQKVLRIYISHKLAIASEKPQKQYPLLADKLETSHTLVYLCKNYACQRPVNTVEDLVTLLS